MPGMHVGICPRMASQGNKPGCTPKKKKVVLRLQAGEPVCLAWASASRLSSVSCALGWAFRWVDGLGSVPIVDPGKFRWPRGSFPILAQARSDQTEPSVAIGVRSRYSVYGLISRGEVQIIAPTLTLVLGRHAGPYYAIFRSACRPHCRERQQNTTVKSPNVTQDRLSVLGMTIAHAARALQSVAPVSLDDLYAGHG